jgi:YbbR domain-containing protein
MFRPKATSEIVLLVGSFFIAIAVWLVAKQNDFDNQLISAKIMTEGASENMIIEIDPPNVNVSIQYPKTLEYLIRPEAFFIELKGINENLAGAEDFNYTPFNITLRNVVTHNLPPTIRPTALGQDMVTLGAKLHTGKAKISVKQTGKPAEGYRLIQNPPRVDPGEILITGSPKDLDLAMNPENKIILLETEPLNIEGRMESSFETLIVKLPNGLRYVKEDKLRVQIQDTLTVRVHVVIGEEERKKTITDIPIVIKTLSENLNLVYSPTFGDVAVEAPISMLEELNSSSFMFIPRQPLEEREGYEADIAVDAKFTDKIPPRIRDKAVISSFDPKAIHIKIQSRVEETPQKEINIGIRSTPSPELPVNTQSVPPDESVDINP